jgi:magnesium transporter
MMTTGPSFIIEFNLATRMIQVLDLKNFEIDTTDLAKIYWIHCDLAEKGILKYLIEKLKLPQDVVQLTKKTDKPSQILEHEETLTLQMECMLHKSLSVNNEQSINDLVIHLTAHYCFTVARGKVPIIERLLLDAPNAVQFAKTPCFMLFLIIDNLVTHYTDILYHYEIKAEDLDAAAVTNQDIYKDIVQLKKRVMNVRRHTIIVFNILNYTTGRDIKAVSKHCRTFLSTLLNNTQTVVNEADSIRELLNGTLGQVDNALMREVNNTMRVLTAVAAIFMPPSLIAGIYGMNFHVIPELTWTYGYAYSLILMLASMVGMLYYFKRNKWY